MCKIRITDDRAWNTSYISTEPADQAVTRGTASTAQTFVETNESGTISTGRDLGLIVDLADLAQSPWTRPMELFDRIGSILNERIETAILARHASWTDFGTADIGGGGTSTSTITVSAANVDDIIRGVKREVREGNGQYLWNEFGIGFVWRAADFEYLEALTTQGLLKLSLIKAKVQQWITHTKQAIALQVKRLSERGPIIGHATV